MLSTPLYTESREPKDTTAHFVLALGSDCVPNQSRQFGDVWWSTETASYGGELKSVSDLLHSSYSKDQGNRLERQLAGLRSTVDIAFLGIYGIMDSQDGRLVLMDALTPSGRDRDVLYTYVIQKMNIQTSMLDAFLWSIQHPQEGSPVTVVWRPTKTWLLDTIITIYRNSAKDTHRTFRRVLTNGYSGNVSMDMLMAIPGIGEETAKLILTRYPSMVDLINGLSNDAGKGLLQLKGIGKKTIESIISAVRGGSK